MYYDSDSDNNFAWFLIIITAMLLLLGILTGCQTARPEPAVEYREKVVTVYDSVEKIDSVYVKDSIIIKQSGDTVFADRWRWRDRWQYIDRWRDSIVYVHDSTDRPIYIEKPLTSLQTLQIKGFWMLLVMLALIIAWRWKKPLLTVIKRKLVP